MNKGFSLYLDALRFGAAFVVLLSHWAYPRFTEGRHIWIRELNLGSDAVVLFFVLSGLVIAFSADRKDPTLGSFTFNRATRLLSVAIPALILGIMLDRIGAALYPQTYDGWWYNVLPLWQQALSALSFTSEWSGQGIRLGTNGPWWSLSYEAAYYLLFAFAFYLRGPLRAGLLIFVVLAIGVNILLLMPVWLLGVWVWRRIRDDRLPTRAKAIAYATLPVALYGLALWAQVPEMLKPISMGLVLEAGLPHPRFSDEWIWNSMIGFGFALHLLGMAKLATSHPRPRPYIRWLAGGSFSLYLIHYPVLQFLNGVFPNNSPTNDVTLLACTLLVCAIFAQVFERSLPRQRAWVTGLMQRAQSTARKASASSTNPSVSASPINK